MSGGSTEPESPHDMECPSCGLYYMDRGNSFKFHKAACDGSVEDAGTDGGTAPNEGSNSTDGSTEPASTDTSTDNPLHDGPEVQRGSSNVGGGASDGTPDTCPDCGSELYDFRDHNVWKHEGTMHDTPDDYYCLDGCGKGWNT